MSVTKSTRRLIEAATKRCQWCRAPYSAAPKDHEAACRYRRSYEAEKPVSRPAPAPVQPTFAEQLAEAIGELIEAKVDYAITRRDIGSAWANPAAINKADARLTTLLGRVAG